MSSRLIGKAGEEVSIYSEETGLVARAFKSTVGALSLVRDSGIRTP